jgi:hypothetical protein
LWSFLDLRVSARGHFFRRLLTARRIDRRLSDDRMPSSLHAFDDDLTTLLTRLDHAHAAACNGPDDRTRDKTLRIGDVIVCQTSDSTDTSTDDSVGFACRRSCMNARSRGPGSLTGLLRIQPPWDHH